MSLATTLADAKTAASAKKQMPKPTPHEQKKAEKSHHDLPKPKHQKKPAAKQAKKAPQMQQSWARATPFGIADDRMGYGYGAAPFAAGYGFEGYPAAAGYGMGYAGAYGAYPYAGYAGFQGPAPFAAGYGYAGAFDAEPFYGAEDFFGAGLGYGYGSPFAGYAGEFPAYGGYGAAYGYGVAPYGDDFDGFFAGAGRFHNGPMTAFGGFPEAAAFGDFASFMEFDDFPTKFAEPYGGIYPGFAGAYDDYTYATPYAGFAYGNGLYNDFPAYGAMNGWASPFARGVGPMGMPF